MRIHQTAGLGDAIDQVTIRDTGSHEEAVTGSEFGQVILAIEIRHTDARGTGFLVFIAEDEAGLHLATDAAQG